MDSDLKKRDIPIQKVEFVMQDFAKKHNKSLQVGCHQDCPYRAIIFYEKAKKGNYFIRRGLYLMLDGWSTPYKYKLVIFISTQYSLIKMFLSLIPFIKKLIRSKPEIYIEKTIDNFTEIIDPNKLKEGLNKAKQIINEFVIQRGIDTN